MGQKMTAMLAGMRILLLTQPEPKDSREDIYRIVRGVEPPHGLASLAAVLSAHGADVVIVDAAARGLGLSQTLELVSSYRPDVVGVSVNNFSLRVLGELTNQLALLLPSTRIVLGGPFPSAFPREALERAPAAEAAFIGEAEESLPAWLAGKKDVVGVAYRHPRAGIIVNPRATPPDINLLPLPSYHLLGPLSATYRLPLLDEIRRPSGSLVLSRGCPFACKFCDRSVTGTHFRKMRPERAVELITLVHRREGLRHIFFHDDTFFVRQALDVEFLEKLKAAGLNVTFGCHIHPNRVPPDEVLRLLYEAGCRMVQMGVESGSPEVLRLLGKKVCIERVEKDVRRLREHGIEVKGLFMVGCPGENVDTIKQTLELIRRAPFTAIGLHLFTPYPGTPIWQGIEAYGQILAQTPELFDLSHLTFVPNGLSETELIQAFYRILGEFYLHPARALHVAKKALENGRLGLLIRAFGVWLMETVRVAGRAAVKV